MVSCIWYHPLCRTCAGSVQRGQKREASSAKWKFLCFSHSCTMTLQMAVLPFVQLPGINPNPNGITSEKKAGKTRLYYLSFWKYLCREEKGAQGPWLPCHINLHLIIKHTHAHTHTTVFKPMLGRPLLWYLSSRMTWYWNVNTAIPYLPLLFLIFEKIKLVQNAVKRHNLLHMACYNCKCICCKYIYIYICIQTIFLLN